MSDIFCLYLLLLPVFVNHATDWHVVAFFVDSCT